MLVRRTRAGARRPCEKADTISYGALLGEFSKAFHLFWGPDVIETLNNYKL